MFFHLHANICHGSRYIQHLLQQQPATIDSMLVSSGWLLSFNDRFETEQRCQQGKDIPLSFAMERTFSMVSLLSSAISASTCASMENLRCMYLKPAGLGGRPLTRADNYMKIKEKTWMPRFSASIIPM